MQEQSHKILLVKANILKFIEFKGITRYQFYKITGVSRGVLDQNNGMSEENILKIISGFPEINPLWLLTGNGEMIVTSYDTKIVGNKNIIGSNVIGNNVSVKVKNTDSNKDYEIEMLKKEIESLHRELKAKDEIIALLRELAKR